MTGPPADPSPAPGSDPRSSVRPRLFVAGAGIMGSGIAAQAAIAGYAVTLEDVNEQFARKGLENAARALDGAVRRGSLSGPGRDLALANIEVAIGLRTNGSEMLMSLLALRRCCGRALRLAAGIDCLLPHAHSRQSLS